MTPDHCVLGTMQSSGTAGEQPVAMLELEDTLKALKLQHKKRLQIHKAPASDQSAPFPLALSLTVDTPDSASHFDVSSINVNISINRKACSPPHIPCPSILRQQSFITPSSVSPQVHHSERSNHIPNTSFPEQHAVYVLPGIRLAVVSEALPQVLLSAIAEDLAQQWRHHITGATQPSSFASGIDVICASIPDLMPMLLALVPSVLDPYETVDEHGGTVRRIAFLPDPSESHDSHEMPVRSGHSHTSMTSSHSTSRSHSTVLRSPVAQLSLGSDTEAMHHPFEPPASTDPPAIEREFRLLRARLASFSAPAQGPPAGFGEACAVPCAYTFSAELQPTDPSWQHGPLPIVGSVSSYAAPEAAAAGVAAQPAGRTPQQPAAAGEGGLAATLQVQPCRVLDTATCVMVNKMVSNEAEAVKGRAGAARALVKYLETHAASIIHTAWDILLEGAPSRQPAGAQAPADTDIQSFADMHFSDGSPFSGASSVFSATGSDWNSTSGSSRSSESGGESDNESDDAFGRTGGESLVGDAIELSLWELALDNVDCMEPLKVKLQVRCTRCDAASVMTVDASVDRVGGASKGWLEQQHACPTCSAHLRLQVMPHMVHQHSNRLAHLKGDGCVPVDLLPLWAGCQCGGCGAACAIRDIQVGAPASRNCSKCYRAMSVKYGAAQFVRTRPPAPRRRVARNTSTDSLQAKVAGQRQARRDQLQTVIDSLQVRRAPLPPLFCKALHNCSPKNFKACLQVGRPLPRFGACHHYSHSHRWLRFPCCGLRFPCDLCHEELTDGHSMQWAKRMICGYCSLEQPCAERCSGCGKRLAATASRPDGRNTRHWEGGKGCRDKRLLDPRDKHKYRNSKHKTVSRRAHRRKAQS